MLTPSPELAARVKALLDRSKAARDLHASKWRTSRIRRLRGGLIRAWQTQDRHIIGQFVWEYGAAIESECRFLEDSAQVERRAAA